MSNLTHRQSKIQEKRKQTPRRQFLMEIASRMPMNLSKNQGIVTPYYQKPLRIGGIMRAMEFDTYRQQMPEIEDQGSFFDTMMNGLKKSQISGTKVLGQNENADYAYITLGAKNTYLSILSIDSQNIFYSYSCFRSTDIYNSILIENSSTVFSSRCVSDSFLVFGSSNIQQSNNIRYCANMIGCSFCHNCNNMVNQSYCINNEFVGKEGYSKRIADLRLNHANERNSTIFSIPGANIGTNIIGSFNKVCENVENGLMNYNIKNAKNVVLANASEPLEYAIDCVSVGGLKSAHIYASMGVGYGCEHVYCSVEYSPNCINVYYSYLMDTCSFCLGCIGLKNKQFCIFNKQYTKEEWYIKVDEIFAQMEKDGQLGAFFPGLMNPFYFNDTAAYLIDPSFTKEEVTKAGYLRRDEPIKVDIPDGMEVVKTDELDRYEGFDADGNWTINADILKKVIQDSQGNVFRIIPMEYKFLVKHGLPLPRKHWLERMKENFRIR